MQQNTAEYNSHGEDNMTASEFQEQLTEKVQMVEGVIRKYLPAETGYAADVIKAMNYSVEAGGKRLRPLFIKETAAMYGARLELVEPFMAALEMIHTYSLVHDDLPAMDNDEYRRGRKTTWAVYGEDMAVIAGDGLLNYAFETALRAYDAAVNENEKDRVYAALHILAKNAGIYGMVGGQCADIVTDQNSESLTPELLQYIHEKKTACLIESGFQIGAVLAGAPREDIKALGEIASDIGRAFQIQDDILDVTGSQEELGKSIGKDAAEGKATYVSMHGLEASREMVRTLTEHAVKAMDSLSEENEFLKELVLQLMTRTK